MKRTKIEKIASNLKMKFDVEPEIKEIAGRYYILVDASSVTVKSMYQMEKYCAAMGLELANEGTIGFKIDIPQP